MDYLQKDKAFEITLSDRKLDHFENETKTIIQKILTSKSNNNEKGGIYKWFGFGFTLYFWRPVMMHYMINGCGPVHNIQNEINMIREDKHRRLELDLEYQIIFIWKIIRK